MSSTPDVFAVAEILVAHAVRTYGADVAIIAYYGSHAKGLATATSDLDICYIPGEGKAASLSSQFILDGLPYDFWPLEWAAAEEIAAAAPGRPWAVAASLLADARILYARSPEDRARFEALQARVVALTQPEAYPFMAGRSLEEFKVTLFRLAQLRLAVASGDSGARLGAAWEFVNSVLNCLALLNQTWFARGWGANTNELGKLRLRPEGLEVSIRAMVLSRTSDEQWDAAEQLTKSVRRMLLDVQASLGTPAPAAEAAAGITKSACADWEDGCFSPARRRAGFVLAGADSSAAACCREPAAAWCGDHTYRPGGRGHSWHHEVGLRRLGGWLLFPSPPKGGLCAGRCRFICRREPAAAWGAGHTYRPGGRGRSWHHKVGLRRLGGWLLFPSPPKGGLCAGRCRFICCCLPL